MGKKGKPRRANGEGTPEYVKSEDCWRIRLTTRTPEGTKRKAFKAKRQRDVIKKRDDFLEKSGRGRRLRLTDNTPLAKYLSDWLNSCARSDVGLNTFRG